MNEIPEVSQKKKKTYSEGLPKAYARSVKKDLSVSNNRKRRLFYLKKKSSRDSYSLLKEFTVSSPSFLVKNVILGTVRWSRDPEIDLSTLTYRQLLEKKLLTGRLSVSEEKQYAEARNKMFPQSKASLERIHSLEQAMERTHAQEDRLEELAKRYQLE